VVLVEVVVKREVAAVGGDEADDDARG